MLNLPLSSGSPLHFTKNQIASNRDKCQSLYINSIIHYDFSRNPLCVIQGQEMMVENLSRMNSTTNKDWWDVILWDEIVSTYMEIYDFVLAMDWLLVFTIVIHKNIIVLDFFQQSKLDSSLCLSAPRDWRGWMSYQVHNVMPCSRFHLLDIQLIHWKIHLVVHDLLYRRIQSFLCTCIP